MKETQGQKEHSERHTRSHQAAAGGRQYRKMVAATMAGQRSARSSLFGQARQMLPSKPNVFAGSLLAGVEEKQSHCVVDGVGSPGTVCPSVQSPDVSSMVCNMTQNCSPVSSLRQTNRSPSSPGYAGARFSEAPSPKLLPKPPNHWVDAGSALFSSASPCREMTDALKGLLKVQC